MSSRLTLIFTLVHGTFARGGPWITDDQRSDLFRSRLRSALGDDYDVEFDDTFGWGHSGWARFLDNTVACRLAAARKLAHHLAQVAREDSVRRYVVAHSHGGNIALYALRDKALRRRIDGLFCLATPFLQSRQAPFRRDVLFFASVTVLLLAFSYSSRLPVGLAIVGWVYAILFVLMTLVIAFSGYLGHDVASLGRIKARLADLAFPHDTELSGTDGAPSAWILKVPDDEVGALMTFAHRVGRYVRRAWQLVNRSFGRLLGVYALIVFAPAFIAEQFGDEPAWIDTVRVLLDRPMTALLLLSTLILFAMALLRLSFAFDSLHWIAGIDTESRPTPWDGTTPRLVTPDPSATGFLRHTQIQSPSADTIAKLVTESIESSRQTRQPREEQAGRLGLPRSRASDYGS